MNIAYKAILLAVVYLILFNLPIAFFKASIIDIGTFKMIIENLVILSSTIIIFFLILSIPYLSNIILVILFIIGGISDYFIFSFKKTFDTGVLIDILSVENNLTSEFIDFYLILSIFLSALIVILILYKLPTKRTNYSQKILLSLACIITILSGSDFKDKKLNSILSGYLPFNLCYSTYEFVTQYKSQLKLHHEKTDLGNLFHFQYQNSTEPVSVVLIIGESMRGSILDQGLFKPIYDIMPFTKTSRNIVKFYNAVSSGISTRISIPYMLTRAIPPNFDQATGEQSIISIYKKLGFATSWIGNQGLFGIAENTFASIALEADYHLIQSDLNKYANKTDKNLDELLIPFVEKRINEVDQNHFMVIHLLGSHWNFKNRYPANSGFEQYKPICNSSAPSLCSKDELINTYKNTVLYSDYILNQIITKLKDKNSIIIYASDHAFSFDNFLGNAYTNATNPENSHIAMFMWFSDKFKNRHLDYFKNAQDKKRKNISHDYIFHSLLDCIGVKSNIIDHRLSLCRKSF